uniref:Zinc finger PHD-type domain-containing protein n=1 Tax=Nothobranchius korthausae TaxID=1143690 RepID=A0A1A8G6W1_9TELE
MGKTEKAAVTSQACAWKDLSRKNVEPAPLKKITFHKPKKFCRQLPAASETVRRSSVTLRALTDDDILELKAVEPEAAVLTSMDNSDTDTASSDTDTEEQTGLPEPLTALFDTTLRELSPQELNVKCEETFQRLKTTTQHHQLEQLQWVTRQQSKSHDWHIHRAGRITSTKFHHVATTDKLSKNYIMNIMQYNKTTLNVSSVIWGENMEQTARQHYSDFMSKNHQGLMVSTCGLVVQPSEPYLGSSPDGIVTCTCCGKGVVEIKCPYKYRESLQGSTEDPKFCLDNSLVLKPTHTYYYQIQLHMFVCDVNYCDFVVWTKKEFIVQRVGKDHKLLQDTLPKAQEAFVSQVLPELLTRRFDPALESQRACKFCGRPDFGKTIDCNKCSGHFHYSCVNIRRKPTMWLCLDCAES